MDCLRAQETLSGRHPAGLIDAAGLESALAHCDSCPTCAAFAKALSALDAISGPEAPDHVVRLTLDAVGRERAMEMSEESDDFQVHHTEEVGRPTGWWIGKFAVTASAAVIFLGAVFLSVRMMTAPLLQTGEETVAVPLTLSETAESDRAADAEDTEAAGSDEAPLKEVASPDYVAFDGVVHLVLAEHVGAELAADTVGTLFTAKDDPSGVPQAYAVYQDVSETTLFIQGATDDVHLLITPVTRAYEGTTYALVADATLDAYGEWPDLPSYLPRPALADGAPVFVEDGQDAGGTVIYARVGVSSSDGIAVGPGTASSDPAKGNPNWTWWEPY